ncbi:MAG: glycosyltransferase [Gammaproteobacteria bacterium]|nr:glycosyltransferase [Gammaproteobacteria bacterium]MDJ0873273.1 glycosyltransferase [Gammaproteobacteria bacterium]MDJ0889942.1 glycosyltransferase [Gammaproteobacteria bacterium]
MAERTRWLFYATNGFGLGHIARTLAIGSALRRRMPEAEYLFLTNSEASNLLWDEGFASVKCPSQESGRVCGLDRDTVRWLNHVTAVNTVAAYRPDVLVVDSFPIGWTGDLRSLLPFQKHRVFIYREKKPALAMHPELRKFLERYDLVLSTHARDEIELPALKKARIESVGPVVMRSREDALPREQARARLGLPADGLVIYVGFGGGGDKEYNKLVTWILKHAEAFSDYTFAAPVPPIYGSKRLSGLPSNLQQFSYFPLSECLSAFDGAVSALGYNASMELLHHGVPSLFVPRPVREDDQLARARRIAEHGAGWVVEPFDDQGLRQGLASMADTDERVRVSKAAQALVPENGADRAAQSLLALLDDA